MSTTMLNARDNEIKEMYWLKVHFGNKYSSKDDDAAYFVGFSQGNLFKTSTRQYHDQF